MRFRELIGGISISLSNEENAFLEKVIDKKHLLLVSLSERDQELARQLTSKGVTKLIRVNGKVAVKALTSDKLGDMI